MGIVWIDGEDCWGEVLKRYFGFCLVSYFKDGIFHEEFIENEELTELKELGIDYESE